MHLRPASELNCSYNDTLPEILLPPPREVSDDPCLLVTRSIASKVRTFRLLNWYGYLPRGRCLISNLIEIHSMTTHEVGWHMHD